MKHKNHVSYEYMESGQKIPHGSCLTGNSNIEASSDRLLIRDAVKKLTPPLRTVVILFYFNEMTTKDISRILNCFQGTIKSRLFKARKLLEKELRSSFEDEFDLKFRGEEIRENG